MLIVYFTKTGNTREIASQIQACVNAEVIQIETMEPYPDDYEATTRQAKRELQSGYKPPLSTRIDGLGAHDIVFVGSPNWWNTIAPPVRSWLSQCDFSGRTIAPFITHEGSGLGQSVRDIAALCPRATVLAGLAVRGGSVKGARHEVERWLHGLGLMK